MGNAVSKDNAQFEQAHRLFIQRHVRESSRERRKRMMEGGHGFAEKKFLSDIWWPAFGHLDNLYPEYEIRDFRDGYRFIDFALLLGPQKVCIEIDGYGSHYRDMNRWQFADQLMRQNHLMLDGWRVLRFAFDDIADKPRQCQQMLLQLHGKLLLSGEEVVREKLSIVEQELLKYALRSADLSVTATMVAGEFDIRRKYAWILLKRLMQKGVLEPAREGAARVRTYRVSDAYIHRK
jgi:hypothetical protein